MVSVDESHQADHSTSRVILLRVVERVVERVVDGGCVIRQAVQDEVDFFQYGRCDGAMSPQTS